MYGSNQKGSVTKDAKITPAGEIPQAGDCSSMGYLQRNKSQAQSDVSKVKRSKIKK